MNSEKTSGCCAFTKVVNGKTYTCYKKYTVKYDKPGRPKMTDQEKLEAKIKRLQKKLESFKVIAE